MGRTNAVESVSSTPVLGLYSSWTGIGRVWLKANGLGLRGFGIGIAQRGHETKLVADLAGVDTRFLPTILLTSGK